MDQIAGLLRNVAVRTGLPTVKHIAAQPITKAVYRITVQYDRMRAADVVATLRCSTTGDVVLEVVYAGHFDNRPIIRQMSQNDYEAFANRLTTLKFDKMSDQPDIPLFGVDLWLVERAAGAFIKSVILAPHTARGDYAQIVQTVRQYLPECVREV